MIARFTTLQVQPDQIDELHAAVSRSALVPRAKQTAGLQSFLLAADRRTGKVVTVTRWESEAAAQAAEPLFQDAMRELGRFIAGAPARESYEVLLQA